MNYDPYSLRRKHEETQSIPTEGAFTKCHQAWDKTVQHSRHGNSSREENVMNSFWRWYSARGIVGHSPHTRCYSHPQLEKVRFRDAKSLVWMSFSWGQVPVGLVHVPFSFEKCPTENKNSYGSMHSIFSTEWGAQFPHVAGFPDSIWTAKRRAHCCCKLHSISLSKSIIHHLENEINDFTSFHNFASDIYEIVRSWLGCKPSRKPTISLSFLLVIIESFQFLLKNIDLNISTTNILLNSLSVVSEIEKQNKTKKKKA